MSHPFVSSHVVYISPRQITVLALHTNITTIGGGSLVCMLEKSLLKVPFADLLCEKNNAK